MARTSRPAAGERGAALALAIFALAVIGGLVALNFFSALLEQQAGRNLLLGTEAAEAAEGGLWELMLQAQPSVLRALNPGGAALEVAPVSNQPGLVLERKVARLADNLFLVQSRAVWANSVGAARSVGLLARLSPDSLAGSESLLPIGSRAWVQLY
jgi:hypothetical protein